MLSRTLHLVFTLTRGNFIAYLICISFHKAKENEKTNKKPSFISVCAANSDSKPIVRSTTIACARDATLCRCSHCVENKECPVYFTHSFIHSLFFSFAFSAVHQQFGRMVLNVYRASFLGRNICGLCSLFLKTTNHYATHTHSFSLSLSPLQ